MAQLLRPDADVTDGAWVPSTGADLYATLDETSADDGDFILTASFSTCEVSLQSGSDPSSSANHIVRYRAKGNGAVDLIVKLIQNTTVIATWTESVAAASFTDYSHTLSAGEANAITDYTDLRLRFEAVPAGRATFAGLGVLAADGSVSSGSGETLVYGPQAFTVGSDINLDTFDANWVKVRGGAEELRVAQATDDVRIPVSGGSGCSNRWVGSALTDQRITGTCKTGSGGFPGFWARADADGNGYTAEWDAAANNIVLYRVTGASGGAGGTYVELGTAAGSVAASTTYTGCYLKATGTNPVILEVGDDTNGPDVVPFSDSDAARHQTGQPGVAVASSDSSAVDDVSIYSIP
jgi:hypothetical protein